MYKKLFSLLIGVMLVSQPLCALTKKQVAAGAAIVALPASGFAYWYLLPKATEDDISITKPLLGALGTFAGTGTLFGLMFSSYTAKARYRWINREFAELEKASLYAVDLADLNIKSVLQESGCESHEFPLVAAFLELQACDKKLVAMDEELQVAFEDASSSLRELLKCQHGKILTDLRRVRKNEAFIKNHDPYSWLEQWKVYQQGEIERERIRQELIGGLQPQLHGHVIYHWR